MLKMDEQFRTMKTSVLSCGYAEESPCTPGFESELFVFKVHRDHLHRGKRLGRGKLSFVFPGVEKHTSDRVTFNNCDGRTRTLFQSVDKRFDVDMDGTVTLKRQVTLHEGHKVFSVHAWDSNGKKHTVSVKVERIHHHEEHHIDTVMNISSLEMESPSDQVLTFPKSSTGAKRAKRGWVIPPFQVPENSRGPFPMKLVQIKSDFAKETQMEYRVTGEGADLEPKGIFIVERLSGNLFVTQALDREKKASYRLVAHAEARDVDNVKETPMEVIINVIDQNDNKPVFTENPFNGHVPEAATKDYEFMRVTATDADDPETNNGIISYKIVSQEPPFPKPNMFDINILSGTIRVRETGMDREPLDFEKTKQYVLSVIVENDDPFVGSLPTATATVTVNVEDVNEPPEFKPKEKIIFKPEDAPIDTELFTYTATDPDTGKSQKIMYKMGNDLAGWLSVSPETGVIKVRSLMDRESAYVKDGKYRAIILAVDDDALSPATGTGTLIIELENVNDNAPVINERIIKICNRGSAPILLSITDKDGPPFGAPFSVETQGETSKNWSTSMNETSTGVFLHLKSQLEQGEYNVVLRVFDQHQLYQDSSIQATVCDCTGDEFQCANKQLAGMALSGVLGILGGILALLLLVLLLLLFLRRKSGTKKEPLLPEDDVRDNIYYYDEEGGGEDDQDYDLSVLHRGLDNRPEVFRNDVAPTFLPAPQYRPRPANPEEIGTFIDDNLNAADNDPTAPPYDSLLVFDYEGGGSDAGSLSSINSSSSGHDQDYDFLNDHALRAGRPWVWEGGVD
ncbi:hypothetical protein cypCar_00035912 [Cyprinus carpio]|nr:hypothetical protein cypCar_00035912 [Cyprinus carpio]